MSETWRLFVAIEPPAPVLEAVARVQDDLKRLFPERAVRWVKPEGVHLTLKFLGNVPLSQIDSLKAALAEATSGSGHRRFDLGVEGLGCFPSIRRPRVIWLGLTGDLDSLRALQADVEKYIAPLGYPTEKREFRPHLTLARASRGASRDAIAAVGRIVEKTDVGYLADWHVGEVSLMRSQLKPGGAVYTQLGAFELTP